MNYYILVDKKPVAVDRLPFGFFRQSDRIVAKTDINDISISTVFLGIDHSFGGEIPILFETMVFGGELDQEMDRYTTWEEAEAGHKWMIERVKNTQFLKEGELS